MKYYGCSHILNDTVVAMLHGNAFSRPAEELSARMAYVDFDGAGALAAAKITPLHEPLPDDFNKAWCPNVIEGIGQLTEWLGNL